MKVLLICVVLLFTHGYCQCGCSDLKQKSECNAQKCLWEGEKCKEYTCKTYTKKADCKITHKVGHPFGEVYDCYWNGEICLELTDNCGYVFAKEGLAEEYCTVNCTVGQDKKSCVQAKCSDHSSNAEICDNFLELNGALCYFHEEKCKEAADCSDLPELSCTKWGTTRGCVWKGTKCENPEPTEYDECSDFDGKVESLCESALLEDDSKLCVWFPSDNTCRELGRNYKCSELEKHNCEENSRVVGEGVIENGEEEEAEVEWPTKCKVKEEKCVDKECADYGCSEKSPAVHFRQGESMAEAVYCKYDTKEKKCLESEDHATVFGKECNAKSRNWFTWDGTKCGKCSGKSDGGAVMGVLGLLAMMVMI